MAQTVALLARVATVGDAPTRSAAEQRKFGTGRTHVRAQEAQRLFRRVADVGREQAVGDEGPEQLHVAVARGMVRAHAKCWRVLDDLHFQEKLDHMQIPIDRRAARVRIVGQFTQRVQIPYNCGRAGRHRGVGRVLRVLNAVAETDE